MVYLKKIYTVSGRTYNVGTHYRYDTVFSYVVSPDIYKYFWQFSETVSENCQKY